MADPAPPYERHRFVIPSGDDARWAVVERVCNSTSLRRSAKLRDLLVYLCHRRWVEGVPEVREQEIGVEVFQRPVDYDSAQDTLVRVQASQLRKRLERYFGEEGLQEPLVLEISKGTYEPVLHARQSPPQVTVLPSRGSKPTVRLLAAVCLCLAALSAWLAVRKPAANIEGESLRRFWTAFARGNEEVTIVIADGAFSAVQDMLQRPIMLDEYVSRGYRSELDRPEHSAEKRDTLRYLMERRYTSLADVMFIKRLWTVGVLDPKQTSVSYSRDLHVRNFEKGNHILVGSRRAVPWVDLFDGALDFHFVYDEGTRTVRVENRRPQPGEPASYSIAGSGHPSDRFSLVASLPNSSKTGNVLILSGQEISGTEAAANLVTTDRLFAEILSKLPPGREGVPRFEALLRVRHVEFTTQGYEILAVHPH